MYIATEKRCALPNQPNQHCLIRIYAKRGQIFFEINKCPKPSAHVLRVPTSCLYEKPNSWSLGL